MDYNRLEYECTDVLPGKCIQDGAVGVTDAGMAGFIRRMDCNRNKCG